MLKQYVGDDGHELWEGVERFYEILADASPCETMLWDSEQRGWKLREGDDGSRTSFLTRAQAEFELERAEADLGYLCNARIVEVEIVE